MRLAFGHLVGSLKVQSVKYYKCMIDFVISGYFWYNFTKMWSLPCHA